MTKLIMLLLVMCTNIKLLDDSNPAIVYAGSLERVDFGEEKEDKGFVHVQLARRNTSYAFHSINPRPFVTLDLNLTQAIHPNKAILDALQNRKLPAVCCAFAINQSRTIALLDEKAIKQATSSALTMRLQPMIEINQNRARIPNLNESVTSTPMAALETYLTEVAPERKSALLARAQDVMQELVHELHSNDEDNN